MTILSPYNNPRHRAARTLDLRLRQEAAARVDAIWTSVQDAILERVRSIWGPAQPDMPLLARYGCALPLRAVRLDAAECAPLYPEGDSNWTQRVEALNYWGPAPRDSFGPNAHPATVFASTLNYGRIPVARTDALWPSLSEAAALGAQIVQQHAWPETEAFLAAIKSKPLRWAAKRYPWAADDLLRGT